MQIPQKKNLLILDPLVTTIMKRQSAHHQVEHHVLFFCENSSEIYHLVQV